MCALTFCWRWLQQASFKLDEAHARCQSRHTAPAENCDVRKHWQRKRTAGRADSITAKNKAFDRRMFPYQICHGRTVSRQQTAVSQPQNPQCLSELVIMNQQCLVTSGLNIFRCWRKPRECVVCDCGKMVCVCLLLDLCLPCGASVMDAVAFARPFLCGRLRATAESIYP